MNMETERLVLRRFREGDFNDFLEYISDSEVLAFEPYKPLTPDEARIELASRIASEAIIAVELKAERKLIGNVYIVRKEDGNFDLGYAFNRNYWHHGYATEACLKIIEQAWADGISRINAECDSRNTASWKLLERLGFVREGNLRRNVGIAQDETGHPIWKNILVYGVLNPKERSIGWAQLLEDANTRQNDRWLSPLVEAGGVAAALLTDSGHVYTGVCIDTASSLGMCAERNAIANMITNREQHVVKMVAIMPDGSVGAPCGACRELFMQIDPRNADMEILMAYPDLGTVTLKELLPHWWGERYGNSNLNP